MLHYKMVKLLKMMMKTIERSASALGNEKKILMWMCVKRGI